MFDSALVQYISTSYNKMQSPHALSETNNCFHGEYETCTVIVYRFILMHSIVTKEQFQLSIYTGGCGGPQNTNK